MYRRLEAEGKLQIHVYAMIAAEYAVDYYADHSPYIGERFTLRACKIVADGAMGSRLYELGMPLDMSSDYLNIVQPSIVQQVHSEYLEAGAQLDRRAVTHDHAVGSVVRQGATGTVVSDRSTVAETVLECPCDTTDRERDCVATEAVGPVEEAKLLAVADLMRERLTFAHDLADATYFFRDPDTYDEAGRKKRWKEDSAELVRLYAGLLQADDVFTEASTEAAMRNLAETQGVGFGRIIHPVRLATTGTTAGAGMFETLVVIGREACIRRLRKAVEVLADGPQTADS
ncbi:MAG: homocysteine S-methyltransferase family protein [Bacteroidetes bacterium]|nr:homocysteine S-methyltransferase family protein [Bacteroidota bacterium]